MSKFIDRIRGAFRPGSAVAVREEPVLAAAQPIGENGSMSGLTSEELLRLMGGGGAVVAGQVVSPDTALRVSTVYGCADLICGAIASLRIGIFEHLDKGATAEVFDHEYRYILNESPCAEMTGFSLWEYVVLSKIFYGDGFAELKRPSYRSSRVTGIKPHHPRSVDPFRHPTTGEVYYRVTDDDGSVRVLNAADMIHVPSLGFDGLRSPSPITYAARQAIATSLAADEFTGKFFTDGATFDYALSTDKPLGEAQLKLLTAQYQSRVNGSRAPLILGGGLKPAQLSINPKDAEILATRLFSVEEICRILGVPPHMVGHTTKTTSWGSGIEQQGTGFVRYTLRRHLTPIAQELNRKFWPLRERYFVEHVTSDLERADLQTRTNSHRTALGRAGEPGWMTVNEVRRAENLPPVPGGDEINKGTPAADPEADPGKPDDAAADPGKPDDQEPNEGNDE